MSDREVPRGRLRFEGGRSGAVAGVYVQVDDKDVADLSFICGGVSFVSEPGAASQWTVKFIADFADDGDPLHRTGL